MATRKPAAGKRAASAKKAAKKKAVTKATARRGGRKTGAYVPEDEEPSTPGGSALVIVESPAKAKTIGKYLGRGYRVRATVGHIMDLPEKKLGIDVDGGFEPELVPIPGKEKTIAELKSAAKESREVFIATDPDREGEAIAQHVATQISPKRGSLGVPIRRVLFHEITKDAVQRAIQNAGTIDSKKVEAQQARRVLDRLVGYKASPVLWKTVKKGLSAGRVQTVALRLIVEREREIRAFKPTEYWTIEALLEKDNQQFTAKLHHIDGKKAEIGNQAEAQRILDDLEGRKTFDVTEVKRRERRKNPSAPFTTSTLQQEAAKKLSFGSKRTMRVASTRASTSAPRARWVSSRTCVPTPRAWRRARRGRRVNICARCSARNSCARRRSCMAAPTRNQRTLKTRTRRFGPPIPRAARTSSRSI
jgi:DNA topoisomerase I